ncbi:MAG TPA: TraB/GumN family protein [Sphingopyxis sp.]|nr:TraB/GumN family protein [Sphingopyxis sp.]HMP45918.1 TraB/GumN family protein [Sphingopyxis sp.]HMQ20091.1 TraB/GumN family protein [Sphingopyxis sp.]
MKKWFKTLAATCAIIPFAQCAMLPGGNVASAAETAPAAATVVTTDARPALWVAKDEDTTVYLFGTVHVLKPGLGWFDEAVKDAFDASDELVLEVVLPENEAEAAQVMIPLALDRSGKTIPSRLSADELTAYQAAVTELGLPAQAFDSFKPWFVAVSLYMLPLAKHGYDPNQGVEKQITGFAKAADKPISGFETLEEQLGFFDTLPDEAQVAYLNAVVRDLDQVGPVLDRLVAEWAKGDPVALAALMNESMEATPELAKVLLYDRNERWADRLKERMDRPGTVFVAVGAGHLAGEKSVQDYLKDRGITVTRVDY